MRKPLLLLVMFLLPMVASAHDIAVKNTDGVTIYYNWIEDETELEVTFIHNYPTYSSPEYFGNVVIPESVNYNGQTYSVTSIGRGAFEACTELTSVTIPNSIKSIGARAFFGCSSLPNISIPNSIESIGGYAFSGTAWYNNLPDGMIYINKMAYKYKGSMPDNTHITLEDGTISIIGSAFDGCNSLTSITIPNSVTSIGSGAFQYCSGLTSINIPNSVTSIGSGAFQYCSGLTSINIPNSVTSIESYAFYSCSSLTSINIPNSVTSIESYAFYSCSSLTSINIPNSVTTIGNQAFNSCSSLKSIIIPNSVTSIGEYAFIECSGLTSITILSENPPFAYDNTFSNYNIPLYVPSSSIEKYQTTNPWSKFSSIKKNEDSGSNNDPTNVINGHEYVDLGLPSGKCWATTNYGSDTTEGYGTYLEWGNNSIVSSSWGTDWMTPSFEDIRELQNNCTWVWDSKNGINGYTVKGKNDKSIFLPACGYMMEGQSSAKKVGQWVYYWTSTKSGEMARIIMCTSTDVWYGDMNTSFTKLPIRPITKKISSDIKDVTSSMVDELHDVVGVYDMQGHKLNGLIKGINIVKCKDGSTKKIVK